MADRWVVNDEYPEGHLVPMTDDEQAQLERDQALGAALAAAQADAEAVDAARVGQLQKAREDLANGWIFGGLSPVERGVIDMLLEAQVR